MPFDDLPEIEAEAEPGDDDEAEAEDEAEDEAELEPGEAEVIDELERAEETALSKMHADYLGAVFEHFGPDNLPLPCPTCSALGYVTSELQPDPSVERCATCHGLGVTATGSVVDGNTVRPCPTCRGAGFTEVPGAEQPPAFVPVAAPIPLPPSTFDNQQPPPHVQQLAG